MTEELKDDERMNDERTHWPQIIGSIVAAIAIVAIAIAITTAKFGTNSSAEIEGRADRLKQQEELAEERREAADERREEAAE